MAKVALLIGVDQSAGSRTQPAASSLAGLQQVLEHPEIGQFSEVRTLSNPDPLVMQQAIEALFRDRQTEDLLLLYFSGRGVEDDRGKLYLTTAATCQQGKFVKSTAVAADFLQDVMNDSQSQQVVLLDCWFGTFENFRDPLPGGAREGVAAALDNNGLAENHSVDIKQLGGPGRAVLIASTCNYGWEDSEIYTDYLVEGLETGAADLNHDGLISLDELQEYTCQRVQTVAPAIQPQMYQPSGQILLAKALSDHPSLKYRQEVVKELEHSPSSDSVSLVSRSVLDRLRDQLGLPPEAAATIEAQVLRPHQAYHKKLQRYAQTLVTSIQQEYPLREETRDRCKRLQQSLGLRDQDVAPIEAQVMRQVKAPVAEIASQPNSEQEPVKSASNIAVASKATPVDAAVATSTHPPSTGNNSRFLIAASIAALVAVTLYGPRQWQALQRLNQLQTLLTQRDYEECLRQAKTFPDPNQPQMQKLIKQCQAGASWQNPQIQTFAGHRDLIWSVAISPDAQTLASGSRDKTIKLWHLQSGKLIRTLSGHANEVFSVVISPDGQTLASSSWDKTIKLWHLQSGKLIRTLSGHANEVWSVAISPDGQTLISGSNDKTVKLWNLQTGQLLRTFSGHRSDVLSVAISPDGQTLISGSKDKTIKLWNLQTGKLLHTLLGHSASLRSVAVSANGQALASSSWDKTIKIWHLPTGKLLRTLTGHQRYVNSIAISPDGQTLASGSDDYTIKLWHLQTGKLLSTLPEHSSYVNFVTFGSNEILASASQDKSIKIERR